MGGNESKKENHVKVENNTFVVNRTDLNVLNKTSQSVSNEVITNIMNSHSTTMKATNRLRIKNTSFVADGDIEITQSNSGSVEITTDFINEVITTLQTDIAATLTSAIENNVSQDIMSKMMNKLDENIKNGWGNLEGVGIGNKSTESDLTDIKNNINITNDTHMDLQNIVELVVNSKINNDISNQCMNNILLENEIDMDMDDFIAKGDIRLNQINTFNVISSCTANNQVISSITDTIAQVFDVKIKEDKQTKSSTDTSSDIKKTKEDQGVGDAVSDAAKGVGEGASKVIDSAGEAGSKVVKSAGEAASSIFSGMTWIFIIIGVVLVAAIVGIVIFLNSDAGQSITQKVADKGLSKIGGCSSIGGCGSNNTFLKQLISGGK